MVPDQAATEGIAESAPRGRPRAAGTDEAVLAAVLSLAGEVGISGISMDDIAREAGVSKTTVYRRWSSKEALVIDALQSGVKPFEKVDTGDLRQDLTLYLREVIERFARDETKDVLPHLIEAATRDPAINQALESYVQCRRRPMRTIFEQAIGRGELPADTDIDVLIDITIGPLMYRRLITHGAIDQTYIDRILTTILPTI